MNNEYASFFAMVAWRFGRGFVGGAIAAMLTISTMPGTSLIDFAHKLGFALIVGGIAGGLMSADKAIRSLPDSGSEQ